MIEANNATQKGPTLTLPSAARSKAAGRAVGDGERNGAFLDLLDQKNGGLISTDPGADPGKSRAPAAQDRRDRGTSRATDALNPTSVARAELVTPTGPGQTAQAATQEMMKPESAAASAATSSEPAAGNAGGARRGSAAGSGSSGGTAGNLGHPVAKSSPRAQATPDAPSGDSGESAPRDHQSGSQPTGSGPAASVTQAIAVAAPSAGTAAETELEAASAPVQSVSSSAQATESAPPRSNFESDEPTKPTATAADQPHARFTLEPDDKLGAQAARGLSAALRLGGGSVMLRLQPQELGSMRVRVDLAGGHVGATFEVGSEQAHHLLDKTLDDLRSALEARGLAVDRLDVHIADHLGQAPDHGDGRQAGNHFGGADPRGVGGDGSAGAHSGGGQHWAGQNRSAPSWRESALAGRLGTEGIPPEPSDHGEAAPHGARSAALLMQPGGVPLMRVRLDAVA